MIFYCHDAAVTNEYTTVTDILLVEWQLYILIHALQSYSPASPPPPPPAQPTLANI